MTASIPADNVFAELTAELDVERIDWEPETPGEQIVGHVQGFEYIPVRSGELMGLLTLRTPSGALARIAAGAKNLRSQLEVKQVRPGDAVAIRYEGRKAPRNGGREFNSYLVAHRALGDRSADPFKVPEAPEGDLGLVPAAKDAWATDDQPPF